MNILIYNNENSKQTKYINQNIWIIIISIIK